MMQSAHTGGDDILEGIIIDELRMFRGEDYKVNDVLSIRIPKLGDICDYGEHAYFSFVSLFTSTPADLLWQLDDMGVDYTKITDWELFYRYLYFQFTPDITGILFGDFDLSSLQVFGNENEVALVGNHDGKQVVIDNYTYYVLTEYVRKIHGFVKNEKKPANNTTKRILIEDAREEYQRNLRKEQRSNLKNLISAMVNSEGFKYDYDTVWNLNIHAFLDSVARVQKIKNATLLLQSGYSGFGVDLKKVKNSQLDWIGDI